MSHPHYHALSSVKKHGGTVEDYLPIHNWFDYSKQHISTVQHRALRHHAEGIFACEREFGSTITNSDGKLVPVRLIGEQHVLEDLGRIPTLADWLSLIPIQPWMVKPQRLSVLSHRVEPEELMCPTSPPSLMPIGLAELINYPPPLSMSDVLVVTEIDTPKTTDAPEKNT